MGEIGWSLSGVVNVDDGSVGCSFALNNMAAAGKTYDGYQLSMKLQNVLPDGAPRCKAVNDGVPVHDRGTTVAFDALGKRAVEGIADDRFSQRIKRALPGLLSRYLTQFNWQPKSIVISGGLANRVSQQIVADGLTKVAGAPLDSPLPVVYVLKGVEQEQLQIRGAALYSKNSDSIHVAAVSMRQ